MVDIDRNDDIQIDGSLVIRHDRDMPESILLHMPFFGFPDRARAWIVGDREVLVASSLIFGYTRRHQAMSDIEARLFEWAMRRRLQQGRRLRFVLYRFPHGVEFEFDMAAALAGDHTQLAINFSMQRSHPPRGVDTGPLHTFTGSITIPLRRPNRRPNRRIPQSRS